MPPHPITPDALAALIERDGARAAGHYILSPQGSQAGDGETIAPANSDRTFHHRILTRRD